MIGGPINALLHLRALRKFHVTDGQNTRDQITKCSRSNCVLCIPLILSGSPNECWVRTCDACVITTWRLGLQALVVACKNQAFSFECNSAGELDSKEDCTSTFQFTTILVTNHWNRSHLSWIFSKFLTFSLHTFVLTQTCLSPSPMLSWAYFGALKWLQTQINFGEGKITQVFPDLWQGL